MWHHRWTSFAVLVSALILSVFLMDPVGEAASWPRPYSWSRTAPSGSPLPVQAQSDADVAQLGDAESSVPGSSVDLLESRAGNVVQQNTVRTSNPAWTWQLPVPIGENFTKARFVSESEGWMVSFSRGLLHTKDGGKTWIARRFGPPLGFYDVFFSDAYHGWAVGRSSTAWDYQNTSMIWCTTDGGKTWTQQYSESGGTGFGVVQFADNLTGWVIGVSEMLKTSDGGNTWERLPLPDDVTGLELTDFVFLDSLNGWLLATPNLVLHTSDGGNTWEVETIPVEQGHGLYKLSFIDSETGWASGVSGEIWQRTEDGTWVQQENPYASIDANMADIRFFDEYEGWAVSSTGYILHTVNGGTTWLLNAVVPEFKLNGMFFSDRYNGWIYGPYGLLYHTTDGGMSWQNLRQGTDSILMSTSFVDASLGWAAGSGGTILRTKDGGKTWTTQTSYVSQALHGIHFFNANRGWAVGENGKILATLDGGAHWSQQKSNVNTNLLSVFFVTGKVGWVVGGNGVILKTVNGGATWVPQDSTTTFDLQKVQFTDSRHGWACANGDSGTVPVILRTEDGGANWTAVEILWTSSQKAGVIRSLHFINALEGWACGAYHHGDNISRVAHTTDGGKTWTVQEEFGGGTPVHIFSTIWFTDENHGYVAGEHGVFYTTVNGGNSWKFQVRPCPGAASVQDMVFVGGNLGFMVADGGIILKTTSGGMAVGALSSSESGTVSQ